jgi:hypothetical protein
MGSVDRTPAGYHSGMGTGVHTLHSRSIYSHSRVLGHGHCLEDIRVLGEKNKDGDPSKKIATVA